MFEVKEFAEGDPPEPIRRETTAEKIARRARGDLTRDETFVLRRRLGLDLTPGDRLLQAAKLENQRRAALRRRADAEGLRELNRMRTEARRLLRFGVNTSVSDGMRQQELRELEKGRPIQSDEPPEQRRERLRAVRERLNQSALKF